MNDADRDALLRSIVASQETHSRLLEETLVRLPDVSRTLTQSDRPTLEILVPAIATRWASAWSPPGGT